MQTETPPKFNSLRHVIDVPLAEAIGCLRGYLLDARGHTIPAWIPDRIRLLRSRQRVPLLSFEYPSICPGEIRIIDAWALAIRLQRVYGLSYPGPSHSIAAASRVGDALRLEFARFNPDVAGRPIILRPVLRRRLWDMVSASCDEADPLWFINAWPWRYLGRVADHVTQLAWEDSFHPPHPPRRIHLQLFHLPLVVVRMLAGEITQTRARTLDIFLHADPFTAVVFWALGRVA